MRYDDYRSYPKKPRSLEERVKDRLTVEDRGYPSYCWIWQGEKSAAGYGRVKRDGRYIPAHWVFKGDPPEGLEVDHLCRVRACVNPDHLEFVTHAENNRRRLR